MEMLFTFIKYKIIKFLIKIGLKMITQAIVKNVTVIVKNAMEIQNLTALSVMMEKY